jgi:hypothetical protein
MKLAKYRLIEISDKLINNGAPFWRIEKSIFGLFWSEYFEQHSRSGATFYNREHAETWYNYHLDKSSRIKIKVISKSTTP